MLQGVLALHDIRDVEAFAERAIQRCGLTEFGYLEREDLLQECVSFIWELSQNGKFNPALGSFAHTAGARLNRFIVDWKRSEYRTRWVFKDYIHERPRPVFVGLEHRPDEPDAAWEMDAAADRLPALLGIERTGDRRAARDNGALGEQTPRIAA